MPIFGAPTTHPKSPVGGKQPFAPDFCVETMYFAYTEASIPTGRGPPDELRPPSLPSVTFNGVGLWTPQETQVRTNGNSRTCTPFCDLDLPNGQCVRAEQ